MSRRPTLSLRRSGALAAGAAAVATALVVGPAPGAVADGGFDHLDPGQRASMSEEIPVQFVFVGYRDVDVAEFEAQLPAGAAPVARYPAFYGLDAELGLQPGPALRELERFQHVALWNAAASRVEMHLESRVDQSVRIDALGLDVSFRRGERIHTESSIKYETPRVDALLRRSGFEREQSFSDDAGFRATKTSSIASSSGAKVSSSSCMAR